MKQIILFSILSILLLSCRKEQTIRISAKNPATGLPYAGLRYVVVEGNIGINNNKKKQLASGELDVNGEAVVNERFHSNRPYTIRVIPPENSCYVKEINYHYSVGDAKTDFPFEFAECSYLQLRVKNINCQNSNDRIVFDMQPTYISDYTNISPTEKWGCYDNEFIDSQVPFGTWSASWEVTKNNVTTLHDTLFSIAPNEHYYLYLTY